MIYKDMFGDEYTEAEAIEFLKHFEQIDIVLDEQVENPQAWRVLYNKHKIEIDREKEGASDDSP